MEHSADAERSLRREHGDVAGRLDEEVLPAGVTDEDERTYQPVAEFEDGLLETVESTADRTFEEVADGGRYRRVRAGDDENSDDS